MICPHCKEIVDDGLKFCGNCGTQLRQADQPHGKQPTTHYSSERSTGTVRDVPNWQKQTDYRTETFDRGPGERPDPSQPLPVTERPAPAPAPAPDGNARATQAESAKKPGLARGALIGIIVAVIAIILIFGAACSFIGGLFANNGSGGTTGGSGSNAAHSTAAVASSSDDTWTVLLYLCGSDLESQSGLATYNLQELASSTLSNKITFAIETGGAKSWQNSTISARYLSRYSIDSEGFYEEELLPAASMAVTGTFADFVEWGTETFPADHYMLVIWDHGGGSVYGVCNDELFPNGGGSTSDTLTLTEIGAGLRQAGASFDVIGFDTCLMATYETADILSPYAEYLVASEEVEPGSGWDYVSWPQWLGAHTGATGEQLGQQICDTYYQKCKLYNAADMATLSVVDLSKVDALGDSFLGASQEIAQATTSRSSLRELYYGAQRTACFGGDPAYNMVDLGDLMTKARSVVPDYYDDVIADVGDAVVYEVHGRSHPNATGLSVFYPLDTSYAAEFYDFLDVARNVPYAQFVAVMYGQYDRVDWTSYAGSVKMAAKPVEEAGIDFAYDERVNDEGQLEIEVTRGLDDLAQATVQMALLLPDQDAAVYLGTDYDVNGSLEEGLFSDNFYGTWMAIDGNVVSAELLEAGDGYNLYCIPVLLNGEESNLIAQCDFDTATYEVICTCPTIGDDGLAAKGMHALEEGDEIEFTFTGTTLNDGQEFTTHIGSVTWSDDIVMEDVDLGEGAYLYRFILTDVLGEEHTTALYVQNYANGEIEVLTLEEYAAASGLAL